MLQDDAGNYVEAPGANLIGIRYGESGAYALYPFTEGALPGISLQTIVDHWGTGIAGGLHRVRPEQWDELWLTGTPFCMLPVVSLDGQPIGDGTIGPVYKETLKKWSELVGLDIASQIINWDYPPFGQEGRIEFNKIWTPDVERTRATQH